MLLTVSPKINLIDVLVDILARELYLEFFIHIWTPDETYLDFETGVLHRISIQIL